MRRVRTVPSPRWPRVLAAGMLAACALSHARAEAPPRPGPDERRLIFHAHPAPPLSPSVPFAGQEDFDVVSYSVYLAPSAGTGTLRGSVIITFEPAAGVPEVRELVLDLDWRMIVTGEITRGAGPGVALPFTRSGDELRIDLTPGGGPLAQGSRDFVTISYLGRPLQGDGMGMQFSSHGTGADETAAIFTMSEPYAAHRWFPCKDMPSDKATLVMRVDAPSTLKAVSNGVLVGVYPSTRDGNSLTVWRERWPVATYLASVAIGDYDKCEWTYTSPLDSSVTLPVQAWAYRDDLQAACAAWSVLPEMMSAFALRFGEFPFVYEKYAQVEVQPAPRLNPYVGMENQTCTSLGGAWLRVSHDTLMAHELAHQWFGDSVTPRTFESLWLNEGFATWAEAAWWESQYGTSQYLGYMHDLDPLLSQGEFVGPVDRPIDADGDGWPDGDASGPELTVYYKGAWVVHMLRWVLAQPSSEGNPALLQDTLKAWTVAKAGQSVDTQDFVDFVDRRATDTYGMRDGLLWFFDEWLHRDDRPCYRVGWAASPRIDGQWQVQVQVEQAEWDWDPDLERMGCVGTMAQPYRMPVKLRITSDGGVASNFIVDSRDASQAWTFTVPARPLGVAWDPDGWILKAVREMDVDTDDDGWIDAMDSCPLVADPLQLDRDLDGVGDVCQPGLDADGDGVPNEADCAPLDPEAHRVIADADWPSIRVAWSPNGLAIRHEMPPADTTGQRPYVVDVAQGRLDRLWANRGGLLDADCVEGARTQGGELTIPWTALGGNRYVVALLNNGCTHVDAAGRPDDPCP